MSDWDDETPEQVGDNGGASTNGFGSGYGGWENGGSHENGGSYENGASRGGGRGQGRGRGRGRGGGFGGDSGCRKCGEEGHMARDCPSGGGSNNRGCFKCGEEGHMSRDCPTGGGGSSNGNRGCYKCGEEGHMARDCPSEGGNDRPERPRGCFNCGEEGHNKADCTNPPKPREEEELGPDGKPRPPLYVPEHITDEQLFSEGVNVGVNFDAYESIPVSVSCTGEVPPPLDTFQNSGLRELLISNVQKAGYTKPTPIQRHCIPTIMAGRDLMGCAQTGSGKTAAFLLPILHSILAKGGGGSGGMSVAEPDALVVAPTRELAIQIHNEARKFALNSILRTVVCYGGASMNSQYRQLQNGCSVLVATPGRLIDFLNRGRVSFASVTHVVLDEADRMLDMGFVGDIEKIMNHNTMPPLADRQTLLFSATFPEEIQTLASKYLKDYVFYVVGTVGAANTDVHQEVLNVPRFQKREMLIAKLTEIMSASTGNKILVFVETKRTADFLASYLSTQQLNSTSIHGDRFQSQREEALNQFKTGVRSILVATAVAARGLDIRGVSHVINYDLPKEVDEYVHRIGRTGRVGNKGQAISFYDDDQDGPIAKNLLKILSDAQQDVPGWLQEAAASSGHSQTYHGVGDFACTDIRGNDMYEESSKAFGGPAAVEEEEW